MRIAPSLKSPTPSDSAKIFLKYSWAYLPFVVILIPLAIYESIHNENYTVLVPSAILAALYDHKYFNFGIRKIPFVKTFIVAIVWANLCCGLHEVIHWKLYFDCFIFIFLLTLLFDFHDIEQDRDENVLTIAQVIPRNWFRIILFSGFIFFHSYLALYEGETVFFISLLPISFVLFKKDISSLSVHLIGDGLIIIRSLIYLTQY